MLKSIVLLGLAANVAAADPVSLSSMTMAVARPLGIIEGGTVMSVPKSGKKRSGKVVILRDRAGQPVARRAPARANVVAAKHSPRPAAAAKSCACAPGGGPGDHVELRNTESGLRVMVVGPDGGMSTRSRFSSPGTTTARHAQED